MGHPDGNRPKPLIPSRPRQGGFGRDSKADRGEEQLSGAQTQDFRWPWLEAVAPGKL